MPREFLAVDWATQSYILYVKSQIIKHFLVLNSSVFRIVYKIFAATVIPMQQDMI